MRSTWNHVNLARVEFDEGSKKNGRARRRNPFMRQRESVRSYGKFRRAIDCARWQLTRVPFVEERERVDFPVAVKYSSTRQRWRSTTRVEAQKKFIRLVKSPEIALFVVSRRFHAFARQATEGANSAELHSLRSYHSRKIVTETYVYVYVELERAGAFSGGSWI